jgi:hypothetical protein
MQLQGEHTPMATDTHTTLEELLETEFSVQSTLRPYNEDQWDKSVSGS